MSKSERYERKGKRQCDKKPLFVTDDLGTVKADAIIGIEKVIYDNILHYFGYWEGGGK